MSTEGHAYDSLGRIISNAGVENIARDFIRRGGSRTLTEFIGGRYPELAPNEISYLSQLIAASEDAAGLVAGMSADDTLDPNQVPVNSGLFGNQDTANRYRYSGTMYVVDPNGIIIDVKYASINSVGALSPDEINTAFQNVELRYFGGMYPDLDKGILSSPQYGVRWELTNIQRSF